MDTLPDLLRESAQRWGDLPAVGFHADKSSWSWTYAELLNKATRVSAYLAELGVGKGDRVVFWGANRPEWVAAFFGTHMLGAIVVPLDVRSQEDLLLRIEQQTEPKH